MVKFSSLISGTFFDSNYRWRHNRDYEHHKTLIMGSLNESYFSYYFDTLKSQVSSLQKLLLTNYNVRRFICFFEITSWGGADISKKEEPMLLGREKNSPEQLYVKSR